MGVFQLRGRRCLFLFHAILAMVNTGRAGTRGLCQGSAFDRSAGKRIFAGTEPETKRAAEASTCSFRVSQKWHCPEPTENGLMQQVLHRVGISHCRGRSFYENVDCYGEFHANSTDRSCSNWYTLAENMSIYILRYFDAWSSILKSDLDDSFNLVLFFNFPNPDFHR